MFCCDGSKSSVIKHIEHTDQTHKLLTVNVTLTLHIVTTHACA